MPIASGNNESLYLTTYQSPNMMVKYWLLAQSRITYFWLLMLQFFMYYCHVSFHYMVSTSVVSQCRKITCFVYYIQEMEERGE